MAYCTQTDLEKIIEPTVIVELTDDTGSGSANATLVTEAIKNGDAIIDSYLQGRYTVPLSTTPDVIKAISEDLALYNLYARRASAFTDLPEWIKTKRKDDLALLKDIRDGKMDVGTDPPPGESDSLLATSDGPERLFTEETMEYF